MTSDALVGVPGSQGREALVSNHRSPDLSTSHPLPQHMVPAWGGAAVRLPHLLWGHVLPRTLAILAVDGLAWRCAVRGNTTPIPAGTSCYSSHGTDRGTSPRRSFARGQRQSRILSPRGQDRDRRMQDLTPPRESASHPRQSVIKSPESRAMTAMLHAGASAAKTSWGLSRTREFFPRGLYL